MSETAKTYLMYAVVTAIAALFFFYPDLAFAQSGGGAIRGKLDSARSSYAIPIGVGIISIGAIIAVICWLFDIIDWKGLAKWCFGAMLIGVIASAVIEFAS